jgi:PDZ domain
MSVGNFINCTSTRTSATTICEEQQRVLVPIIKSTKNSNDESIVSSSYDGIEIIYINTPMYKIECMIQDTFLLDNDLSSSSSPYCECTPAAAATTFPMSILDNSIPEAIMIPEMKLGHNSIYGGQEISGLSRPSFVFCHVVKPRLDYPVGLTIDQMKDGTFRICTINNDSLFVRNNCIQHGDELIAINGISIKGLSKTKVNRILSNNSTTLSITIKNKGGDPNLFLSCIEKPTIDTPLGIHLRNRSKKGNILLVDNISDHSILNNSLLSIGHQIVSINDIDCKLLRATDVKDLITMSSHSINTISNEKQQQKHCYYVNILSRVPKPLTIKVATVVCCEPVQNWQLLVRQLLVQKKPWKTKNMLKSKH